MSNYSIWVLEYAYANEFPISGAVYGMHNEGTFKFSYCYVVISGNDHNVLVDVGFDQKEYGKNMAGKLGITNWRNPRTVLAEVGLTPEDIDTVLVTHAHFDHFGNVDEFPNAKFYIQRKEFTDWMWAITLPKRFSWLTTALDPADMLRGAELARDGRLILVDGDLQDVIPNIDLFIAEDTHTFGTQFVRVRNGEKNEDSWVLSGDLVYVYDNIEGRGELSGAYIPIGLATGSQKNLLFTTDKMMKMVQNETRRIVPTHEAKLVDYFPSRVTDNGLYVVEVTLAKQHQSKV